MTITLREIHDPREMLEVEAIQREVWGFSDLEVIPGSLLVATVATGGILIGAFEGDVLAGYVYGFVGLQNRVAIIHSDMLAVRSEHRGAGLGLRLKLAQREMTLARGIHRITWTFDPLQSENAHLNLARLGATADRYVDDFYGETTSALHAGSATDRLWISWDIDSERVRSRISGEDSPVPPVDATTCLSVREDGKPRLEDAIASPAATAIIEIPTLFRRLIAHDRSLAVAWRMASREAFHSLLSRGYVVTGLLRGPAVGKYLLEHKVTAEDTQFGATTRLEFEARTA